MSLEDVAWGMTQTHGGPTNGVNVFEPAPWLRLVLPEPPSANRYWRLWRGKAVKSEAARAYGARAMVAFQNAKGRKTEKPVAVTMHWYRGRRSGDLDNRAKVALDALQGLAYHRDSQVVELHMYRHDDKEKPRLEVVIREIAA